MVGTSNILTVMKIHPSFRSRFLFPLNYPDIGTGTGGGTGTGTGTGAGAPGSSGSPAAGAGTGTGSGGGTGDRTVYDFSKSDSAFVRTADGREIPYKDWEKEYNGTVEGRFKKAYQPAFQALLAEAEKIDKLNAGRRTTNTGGGDGQPDPFAEFASEAVIDGPKIVKLVGILKQLGLDPLAKMIQDQGRTITELQKHVKGVGSYIGSANEERASQQFEDRITKTLGSLEIKGLAGAVDTSDPSIREFARNLYLSYEPGSWKAGEYEKMLGDQLSSVVMAIRKMDRAHADGASDRLRQHFDPTKGAGSPRGNGKYKFESPREISAKARAMGMFGGGSSAT